MRFLIADVFAEEKYAGNQLAVIRDCAALSTEQMQRITREMNFSETTFILSEKMRNGGFDVRIFTPGGEVPFAGHPTLGTAAVIRSEIGFAGPDPLVLNLKVGPIPVTLDPATGLQWMRQNEPVFGRTLDGAAAAKALRLDPADIDARFPVQEVSTGLPFVIVPLKTRDAVRRARLDEDAADALTAGGEADAIFLFAPQAERPENQIRARMFAPKFGVPEDPATGSANGCLTGYLVKHRFFGGPDLNVRVEQGWEMGRPSLLYLRGAEKQGKIQIEVGGRTVLVGRGELV